MRVLVTGGSSVVGEYLLPRLAGDEVTVLSRKARPGDPRWHELDAARQPVWGVLDGMQALIHLAPLTLLPKVLDGAPASLARIVAIGTTSVHTKADSPSAKDQTLVREQRAAEERLAAFCSERGIGFTLFRPTLVYDGRRDKNIARIAALVRRFGFFPVAAPGKGLRQPLHADDLAAACVAALEQQGTHIYELGGGETLSYRAMLARIFESQGRAPHILALPVIFYRAAIVLARLLPRYRGLTPEVADRMNQDMVFDWSAAARDFGFRPRGFTP